VAERFKAPVLNAVGTVREKLRADAGASTSMRRRVEEMIVQAPAKKPRQDRFMGQITPRRCFRSIILEGQQTAIN
jgi:hypothetical protein